MGLTGGPDDARLLSLYLFSLLFLSLFCYLKALTAISKIGYSDSFGRGILFLKLDPFHLFKFLSSLISLSLLSSPLVSDLSKTVPALCVLASYHLNRHHHHCHRHHMHTHTHTHTHALMHSRTLA